MDVSVGDEAVGVGIPFFLKTLLAEYPRNLLFLGIAELGTVPFINLEDVKARLGFMRITVGTRCQRLNNFTGLRVEFGEGSNTKVAAVCACFSIIGLGRDEWHKIFTRL